jgi:hypothetical protein
MRLGLRLQCKVDLLRCLDGNRQQECRFTSGINCLIRVATFVKERARETTSLWSSGGYSSCDCHLQPTQISRRSARQLNVPHQLLQHATAQDKDVRYTFCSDLISRLEDDVLYTANIFSVMKPHSIYREMLINTKWEFWGGGGKNAREVIELTRNSPKLHVFCTLPKQNFFGPLFFAESTVTGIVHLDMLGGIHHAYFGRRGVPLTCCSKKTERLHIWTGMWRTS